MNRLSLFPSLFLYLLFPLFFLLSPSFSSSLFPKKRLQPLDLLFEKTRRGSNYYTKKSVSKVYCKPKYPHHIKYKLQESNFKMLNKVRKSYGILVPLCVQRTRLPRFQNSKHLPSYTTDDILRFHNERFPRDRI